MLRGRADRNQIAGQDRDQHQLFFRLGGLQLAQKEASSVPKSDA
jgi:hypothetical protein